MPQYQSKTSNESVKKATGKTWPEWIKILNKLGAKKMSHKDIVIMLEEKELISSSWWRQMVTVEYEKFVGKRVLGETADTGFQIGVQKTVPLKASQAWNLLTSPKGRKLWLGTIEKIQFKKGETFTTKEGTNGEIRSIDKNKRIRLTWQPKNFKTPSTLQIYLLESNKNCSIRFHQEKLPSAAKRTAMKTHWKNVLQQLNSLIISS